MRHALLCLCLALAASAQPAAPTAYKDLGYVVVSPQGPTDGGNFGPNTPGTRTSGLQEAINHAREIQRDVYIVGGGAKEAFKNPVVYTLTETLRIPWMQDFRLEGGQAVIQNNSPGDAIVFDSQMSCWFKFGLIVSASPGTVVRLRPETTGPDNFKVITACKFEFGAIVGAGNVFPGEGARGKGVGLFLDAEHGPVDGNEILVSEVVACDTGIQLSESATNNWIRCPFLHLCNTHLIVGAEGGHRARLNRIEAFIDGGGLAQSTGAILHGQNNLLTLSFGANSPNKNLILGPAAADNYITALNLPNGHTSTATAKNRLSLPSGDHYLGGENAESLPPTPDETTKRSEPLAEPKHD